MDQKKCTYDDMPYNDEDKYYALYYEDRRYLFVRRENRDAVKWAFENDCSLSFKEGVAHSIGLFAMGIMYTVGDTVTRNDDTLGTIGYILLRGAEICLGIALKSGATLDVPVLGGIDMPSAFKKSKAEVKEEYIKASVSFGYQYRGDVLERENKAIGSMIITTQDGCPRSIGDPVCLLDTDTWVSKMYVPLSISELTKPATKIFRDGKALKEYAAKYGPFVLSEDGYLIKKGRGAIIISSFYKTMEKGVITSHYIQNMKQGIGDYKIFSFIQNAFEYFKTII